MQIELGDDILNQIGAGDKSPLASSVEFDEAGTVHVRHRDGDGDIDEDISLSEERLNKNKRDITGEEASLKSDISDVKKKNSRLRIYFYLIIFGSIFACAMAVMVLSMMR